MLRMTSKHYRNLHRVSVISDLTIVGGGLAGTCCAITAARAGVKVALVQDRPVLGGNASSEVRLWALGATSHMNSNNRWAREGGVIDEIMVENLYHNPEGNPILFDSILLDKVSEEENITLFLNTAIHAVKKNKDERIHSVSGFNSQNSTLYEFESPLHCDASGDGIVGYLSGASFRMGAETCEEFGEKFAPSDEYGELLGHSIYFYSKDTGRPVRYIPPRFALADITQIPRFRSFNSKDHGCKLWWIEWGGRLDTVYDTERIKWELWEIVYGVWDYIKNSGDFPDAENHTLEWIGHIPGKRESRRFEGDYILRQQDIIDRTEFEDAVSYGGWSIDLHPADGIFSVLPGCNQWHSKGVYQIPWRCLYSRNIQNLFLAGRIISSSHVSFGSTRVMATCAHSAQAVGVGAAICLKRSLLPSNLQCGKPLAELQTNLLRMGQYIPEARLKDPDDLVQKAHITASSELRLGELKDDGPPLPLKDSWAMLLPVQPGPMPLVTVILNVSAPASMVAELRTSSFPNHYTPDLTLDCLSIPLKAGEKQSIPLRFQAQLETPRYVFVCLMHNENITVLCSEQRMTGVLSVCNHYDTVRNIAHAQEPPKEIGVDAFEFWTPRRRPAGANFSLLIEPSIDIFAPENIRNGIQRPTQEPNAWVADLNDPHPSVTLTWDKPQTIRRMELAFDTDFDHPMETVQMGHPERAIPFCVRNYRIKDREGAVIHETKDNHQTINRIQFHSAIITDQLTLEMDHPSPNIPVALFEIRCYA